jgi:hypothetical protein
MNPKQPKTTDAEVKDLAVLVPTLKGIIRDRPEALTFTLSRDILVALLLQTEQNMKRLAHYDAVRKSLYDSITDDETVGHLGWATVQAYRNVVRNMDGDA